MSATTSTFNNMKPSVKLSPIIGVTIAASFALIPTASAAEPHAFAVQPVGCTPGYVHINHSPGVDWTIGGDPVEVTAPASEFPFPYGFQGAVEATAAEPRTYYLTVNAIPSSCYPPVVVPPTDPPAPVVTTPPLDLERVIADLKVQRTVLQAEVLNLRREVRKQDRIIDRLRAKISRLR